MMPKQIALWTWLFPLALLVCLCVPKIALSEGLTLLSDQEYLSTNADVTDKQLGVTTENDFDWLTQLYSIDLRKEIYPHLDLQAGWLINQRNQRAKIVDLVSMEKNTDKTMNRTVQYFAGLNLDNPLHNIGLTYRKGEDKNRADDTEKIYRDQAIARWAWRPADLPSFNFDFNRSAFHDKPRTRDSLSKLLSIRSRYDYEEYSFDYTHTRTDNEEKEQGTDSLTKTHDGGVRYSTRLFDDRLALSAGARANYSTLNSSGGGDLRRDVGPVASTFYLLDDPGMGTTNDSGDFTTVDAANPLTAVNIGRGGPLNPVSMGVEFSSPTEVSIVYVFPEVDTDGSRPGLATSADIDATTFVWEVFISDDQENWTLQASATSEYNRFDIRFEILFDEVITRYVKVRTIPHSNLAGGRIPISRLQLLTTVPGTAGETLKDLEQNYNLGARWAATDRTSTTYDVYLKLQDTEPTDQKRTHLTNSASIRHTLSPIFVANARVLRSDIRVTGRKNFVNHNYVASIRGDYLDTFNQTLLYSGNRTKEQSGTTTVNSIFLRNSADLYRDWSANLDLGQIWKNSSEDGNVNTSLLKVRTNLIPNPKLQLNLDYTLSRIAETGEPTRLEQRANGQLFFVPWTTLSLYAQLQYRDRNVRGETSKLAQDYSATWTPFPDGSFNVSMTYTKSKDREGRDEEFLSPVLRWEIARGILFTFRYDKGTVESATQKSDLEIFNGKLRIFY